MEKKGHAKSEVQKYLPFHERHKQLLILCTLSGLKIRAVDRIVTTPWKYRLLRAWSTLVHVMIGTVVSSSLLHLLFVKKVHVLEIVHDIMLMGCSTHSLFRQFYMHKNIEKFDELYTTWDDLFGHDDDWKTREKSINSFYKAAQKAIGGLGIGTTTMLTIYSVTNLMAPDKRFNFPTVVPYRHQSPDFEIIVWYYSIEIFFFAISVASSQMLLITPILWELGELTRLQTSLAEIFRNSESITEEVPTRDGEITKAKTYTKKGIATVTRKMKVWVDQNKKLTMFHAMSRKLNNFELSMEMIATFIEACGLAILCSANYYQGAHVHLHRFGVISAFVGYYCLFYYVCAKCNQLSDLSMAVADDAFAENWSALPTDLKKNFLLIIARTSKQFNYYGAIIFRIDMETFSTIFRTAYSVFQFYFTVVHR